MKISAYTYGYSNNYSLNKSNNRQNTQPQFTGMTSLLKKKVYIDGKKDIMEIIERRGEDKNTLVGQLPPGMFYKLPADKAVRADAIRDIMNTFGEVAREIRAYRGGQNVSISEYRNRRPDSSVDKLRDLFARHGLVKEEEKTNIDLEFLGKGDYGAAYKIKGFHDEVTNDDYILKIHTVADKSKEWHRYKSHGNYAEPNTAAYWKYQWGQDTQRGKFYWADINSGYMVDNFIDMNTPPYKKHVNEYMLGLKLCDEEAAGNGHNKINNYSIDWGGVRVVNRIKNSSKTARAVLYDIKYEDAKYREAKWWEIYERRDKYDDTHKKAGLALAIKHLNNKPQYIDTCLSWNKPMVDQSLAYVLKYLPHEEAKRYFEILMKRKDPTTQVVAMNEIPLLARKPLPEAYDDLDVPKGQIDPNKIKVFYDIAKKHAVPESREHLASYVHLLPDKDVMSEFHELALLDDYATNDRLLHKIKVVPDEDFSYGTRLEMLSDLSKTTKDPEIKQAAEKLRIYTIRKNLAD